MDSITISKAAQIQRAESWARAVLGAKRRREWELALIKARVRVEMLAIIATRRAP